MVSCEFRDEEGLILCGSSLLAPPPVNCRFEYFGEYWRVVEMVWETIDANRGYWDVLVEECDDFD